MKKLFQEFRAFIAKGNVIDMAIGVIVGGAFGKIVSSLVNDIIMPVISLAMGGKSMVDLAVVLNGQPRYLGTGEANPAALLWHYGSFIQSVIDFLIIAICVFLIMKLVVTLQRTAKTAKNAIEKGVTDLFDKEPNAEATGAQETSGAAETAAAEAVAPTISDTAEIDAETAATTDRSETEGICAAESPTGDRDAEIVALLTEIRNALKKDA